MKDLEVKIKPKRKCRPVVPGCAGCAMAHPIIGRSVNPISTRGTDYAHLITTGTPGFSDLPTALSYKKQPVKKFFGRILDLAWLIFAMAALMWIYLRY